MSESDQTDQALDRVRETFEDAVEGVENVSDRARGEVHDAIDDLEDRIEDLRERT
jgi:hypothetical protein